MCKFRDLRADEIDVRVQQAKDTGVGLLLYKDARVDMNILDETVGPSNWQNRFYENKGILFCSLGINTNFNTPGEPDRWVYKDDAGVESNTEAEKGNASDARKRAGFAWGIGRELYTSPFIWVKPENCNLKNKKDSRGNVVYSCYDKFVVSSITIENKEITALEIYNQTKKCIAFTFPEGKKNKSETPKAEALTYEKALELKLTEGDYAGRTLKEVYKMDRMYINSLASDERTPKYLADAIAIINAEIRKANAK